MTRRMLGAMLFLALGGCGSSDGASGNGVDAGTGGAGTGGSSGTGGNPNAASIPCGPGLTCTGGQKCCIPLAQEEPVRCAMECTFQKDIAVSCLGTDDCNGNACCGSALFGYACVTSTSCPGVDKQLCQDPSECATEKCIPQTLSGVELAVCAPE